MSNVIRFPLNEETPDEMLARLSGAFSQVAIVGITTDGHFIADAAGNVTFAEVVGLLALGQQSIMRDALE